MYQSEEGVGVKRRSLYVGFNVYVWVRVGGWVLVNCFHHRTRSRWEPNR